MTAEDLPISNGRTAATHSFRRSGVAEVPQHDDGRFVILRGGDEARRLGQLAMLRSESLTCSGCQQTSLMPLRLPICRPAVPATASMPLAAPPPYCKLTISLPALRSHTEV